MAEKFGAKSTADEVLAGVDLKGRETLRAAHLDHRAGWQFR